MILCAFCGARFVAGSCCEGDLVPRERLAAECRSAARNVRWNYLRTIRTRPTVWPGRPGMQLQALLTLFRLSVEMPHVIPWQRFLAEAGYR